MLLTNFELKHLADKVHVHRWPMDSPIWDDSIKKELDDSINKNPEKKQVTIKENLIQIENFKFTSLKKLESLCPFLKKNVP